MSEATGDDTDWTPWRVVPDSGFEVAHPSGGVGITQIDHKRFLVLNTFRYSNPEIERYFVEKLIERGDAADEARLAVEEARTFSPRDDNPTDLASIPRYLRWFENPYGKHSLAALIHDELITKEADGGRLGSDTLSDRFFREMMKTSGVPWLKRWIMWAAVAGRTRFVAGGLRRWTLLLWFACSAVGVAATIDLIGAALFDWPQPLSTGWMLLIIAGLPFVTARLWGEQWGASFLIAVAAPFILPAALLAYLGYAMYHVLEHLARTAGYE